LQEDSGEQDFARAIERALDNLAVFFGREPSADSQFVKAFLNTGMNRTPGNALSLAALAKIKREIML